MFFWIALPIVFIAFACAFFWGVRGYDDRIHEPGTRHLDEKAKRRRARRRG